MLPTPLPDDASSELNDFYFTDTPTQDSIAVIDACLHNLSDVPRAREVFQLLRQKRKGEPILSERVYNSMISAYIDMATTKDTTRKNYWVEDACTLFEDMENGKEYVQPNAGTFALMLLIWHRFNPDAPDAVTRMVELITPTQILKGITERNIPITLVVADKALTSSEEAEAIIKTLSRTAVEMNLSKVIQELGAAEILGRQLPDPLDDVPEPMPVLKEKVRSLKCYNR